MVKRPPPMTDREFAALGFCKGVPTEQLEQAIEAGGLEALVGALDAVVELKRMHEHFGSDKVTAGTLVEFVDEKLAPILAPFKQPE